MTGIIVIAGAFSNSLGAGYICRLIALYRQAEKATQTFGEFLTPMYVLDQLASNGNAVPEALIILPRSQALRLQHRDDKEIRQC
jgi:hypothetical protein